MVFAKVVRSVPKKLHNCRLLLHDFHLFTGHEKTGIFTGFSLTDFQIIY